MNKNPFKMGEVIDNSIFCNRKIEIKRLQQSFYDGQNTILISPRRWGKSSLVSQAVNYSKHELVVISLDCFALKSVEEFYSNYLKACVIATQGKVRIAMNKIGDILGQISPFITYTPPTEQAGEFKIGVHLPHHFKDHSAILEIPNTLYKKKGIPVVVCIDEFQKLFELSGGKELLETLRSVWQKHTKVSYCLYGSKRHIMNLLFNSNGQPFYRFGDTLFLPKIATKDWVEFIIKNFKDTGLLVNEANAKLIVELTEGHSYYVQLLCRTVWDISEKNVAHTDIQNAYDRLLEDQTIFFKSQTEGLTQFQVNYIRALEAGETKFGTSKVQKQYNMGTSTNIKRIEAALRDYEIIDTSGPTIMFCEPFFIPLFRRYF